MTKRLIALGCSAVCVALLAACGSQYAGVSDHPPPARSDFPGAAGKTLAQIASLAKGQSRLAILPTQSVYDKGTDRYGFGVFTAGQKPVTDAAVALYFAHGAHGIAEGPYPARVESLATDPAYVAQTTAQDPQAAKVVYVVDGVKLNASGEWRVLAMVKQGDSLQGSLLPSATVGGGSSKNSTLGAKPPAEPPDVGQPAPRIHTPTAAEVGGDLSQIDTRDARGDGAGAGGSPHSRRADDGQYRPGPPGRTHGASAELLGQPDDDALRAAQKAEPVDVLVLRDLADELGTVAAQAGNDIVDVVDHEHDAAHAQRVRRRAFRLGSDRRRPWNLDSSTRPWPSGVRIIAMSARTSLSPTVWSTQGPSTVVSPSSSIPSSTKNALAASRSSTTMSTLSIR